MLFLVLGTISQRHLLITMLMPKKCFKAFFHECIILVFRVKIYL